MGEKKNDPMEKLIKLATDCANITQAVNKQLRENLEAITRILHEIEHKSIIMCIVFFLMTGVAQAEEWKTTAYDACLSCCGKTDGIMASGKTVYVGAIAVNWLPFGTKLTIDGKEYTVEDRGAKSQFGSKENHIKHLDIYFPTHEEARQYGVQYREVIL